MAAKFPLGWVVRSNPPADQGEACGRSRRRGSELWPRNHSGQDDQMIVFAMMRQIERWINRKLKSVSTAVKFKVNILDVTYFNRQEVHDRLVKDGQYGMPVRSAIMATSGYSPSDVENMQYLENTVLNLSANEVPLISSNTQSAADSNAATDEGGRPTNASEGKTLTDAGENSSEEDLATGG